MRDAIEGFAAPEGGAAAEQPQFAAGLLAHALDSPNRGVDLSYRPTLRAHARKHGLAARLRRPLPRDRPIASVDVHTPDAHRLIHRIDRHEPEIALAAQSS